MKKTTLCLLLATFINCPAISSTPKGDPHRCNALAQAYTVRTGQQVPCNRFCHDPLTQTQVPCFIYTQDESGRPIPSGLWCGCSGNQTPPQTPSQIGIGFPGTGTPINGGGNNQGNHMQCQQLSTADAQRNGTRVTGLCGPTGNCPPGSRCVSTTYQLDANGLPLNPGVNCQICQQ